MKNLTLKQLRYFEAVAACGHFGRAAVLCSISQPAISLQIKELEESVGQLLFERQAKQVRLTAFGEKFAQHVQPILQALDDLSDLARSARNDLVGPVRMGVIPTIAPYLLPRIIKQLSAQFTDLDVHIRETQTEKLIADLMAGHLDVALVALPISEPFLTEMPLFDEKFVLIRSVNEANKPVPDSSGLAQMRLLLLEEGHCFRDQALAFCSIGKNTPVETMEGSSLTTLVQMVGAGMGVTLIPEMAVPIESRLADVSVAQFAAPAPKRSVGMVWRKTSPLAAQLALMADVIKAAV